ncbi:NAD(P)-dependent oxidoreductase [Curtobacterium sp. MCJR17_055]|nr:NAD(P)-dependent oxidoreductase [Curtobacterium sp. MCBD17_029]PYY55752.1 NAD(P)-dependent oxidoreductase [Curtobacterium sp. MCJR17_055]PYY60495.1 NAD(P)-dependent oxidoreductase [Curtobacterium sp. MCPF17_015]
MVRRRSALLHRDAARRARGGGVRGGARPCGRGGRSAPGPVTGAEAAHDGRLLQPARRPCGAHAVTSTVAVTGGSGFVGGRVISALKREGHHVIDLGRRPGRGGADEHVHVDLAAGRARVPRLGDVPLVHCAAEVRDGFDRGMFDRNSRIMESALALTTGGVVHVSSSSVYNLARPSVRAQPAEATGRYRWYGTYGESKFANEGQLVAARRASAVILRPHAVYGSGDATLLPRVLRASRYGVLPLPLGGRAPHALTWVDNLAAAVLAALRADVDGTHAVNVTDDDPVPIGDAFRAVVGRPLRVVHVPMRTARHVAAVARGRSGISPYSVRQLGLERTYDVGGTEELLGWAPEPGTLARLAALRPS